MPITFLGDRRRPQRLGRVRLGIKKENEKTGKSYPVATPYFVLRDAPALLEFCEGAEPTELRISFLWDNLESTFPHYLRRYVKSGLRCLGDGEFIMYRLNDQGVKDVSNVHALDANGKPKMDDKAMWIRAVCPGDQCPQYIKGTCKPTGFLRFVPTEAPRQGYYDMVCRQHAIVGIKTQLVDALELFGHITDIPFVLHRGDVEKLTVKTAQGAKKMPVRTQWLEIEPAWFAENYPRRAEHLSRCTRTFKQNVAALFGEDGNGDESLVLPADNSEFAEPAFAGEGETEEFVDEATGEIVEPVPEKPPEAALSEEAEASPPEGPPEAPAPIPPPDATEVLTYAVDKKFRQGYPWHRRTDLIKQLLAHPIWSNYVPTGTGGLERQDERIAASLHQIETQGKKQIEPAMTDAEVYEVMDKLGNVIADRRAAKNNQ